MHSQAKLAAPVAGSRRRKGEGHARREEILEAAQSLFSSEGYDHTTIRRIAERVGVTPPVLYRHFKGKGEILLEICVRCFGELAAEIDRVLATEADPLKALRRMGENYVRFGLAHPDEYRLVFMSRDASVPGYNHRMQVLDDGETRGRMGAVCFGQVTRHVAQLVQAGTLRAGDPATVAELLWIPLHGLVSLLITKPDFPWSGRETLIQGVLDMAIDGLVARR
jgi:AcrR family transcriptional regulator